MDIEVSKLKFSQEKELLLGEAKDFVTERGWDIVEFQYPIIAVVLPQPEDESSPWVPLLVRRLGRPATISDPIRSSHAHNRAAMG